MSEVQLNQKPLYTYIEVDDTVPVYKLSIKDQIYAFFHSLFSHDADELKAEDALSVYRLQLKATLSEFLGKAAEPLKKGKHTSVVTEVSNTFKPVLDEVLASKGFAEFFKARQVFPETKYSEEYKILVCLEVI